jgi:hypothetical protein
MGARFCANGKYAPSVAASAPVASAPWPGSTGCRERPSRSSCGGSAGGMWCRVHHSGATVAAHECGRVAADNRRATDPPLPARG